MNNIKPIYEYDSNGNIIHHRDSDGFEYWEYWCEYDSNSKPIHIRNNSGFEKWYDSEGNEYQTQEEAIRANTMINLNTQIKQMSLDDLIVLENLIKDRFIQHYNEVSERIRKEP